MPRRTIPMSVREQCELQYRMLEHFQLPGVYSSGHWSSQMSAGNRNRLPRKTALALEISDVFFMAMDDPFSHDIHSPKQAIEYIRYEMGYSWLAWMFARYFITALIKWLWAEYHK